MRTSPSWRQCVGIPGQCLCSMSWKKPTRRFSKCSCPSWTRDAHRSPGQMRQGSGSWISGAASLSSQQTPISPLPVRGPWAFPAGEKPFSQGEKKIRHASRAGGAAISGERRGPAGHGASGGPPGDCRAVQRPDRFPAPGRRGAAGHRRQADHLPRAGIWATDHPGRPGSRYALSPLSGKLCPSAP